MDREFISIERMNEILDEIATALPRDLFKGLNGGILLLPEHKYHKASIANDLYVLGEYTRSKMGKYITIYYGSFRAAYPHMSEQELRNKLESTLLHEFTHHLEGNAGDASLEYEDAA